MMLVNFSLYKTIFVNDASKAVELIGRSSLMAP